MLYISSLTIMVLTYASTDPTLCHFNNLISLKNEALLTVKEKAGRALLTVQAGCWHPDHSEGPRIKKTGSTHTGHKYSVVGKNWRHTTSSKPSPEVHSTPHRRCHHQYPCDIACSQAPAPPAQPP